MPNPLRWLLSLAMEPMVQWLIKRGIKRGVASAIVLFGMMIASLGIAALLGQLFVAQAQQLRDAFPTAVSEAVRWVNETFDTSFNVNQIYANLQLTPERVGQLAQQYGGGLLGVFGSVVTVIAQLVTILVFAYYLSADSIRLRQTIGSWMPQRHQPVLVTIWSIAVEKTGGYVVSKLILALLSAVFHCVFFLIIQVPFWLPLGILAGIVGQFVPIIGTYIGVILPGLFALLDQPIKVLYIIIFATIFQQIESYWFTPKVSNKTMDIHPAVALGAVFVGVGLFGPIGALIGIPVAAAALSIVDTLRRRHELMPELSELQDDDGSDEYDSDGDGGYDSVGGENDESLQVGGDDDGIGEDVARDDIEDGRRQAPAQLVGDDPTQQAENDLGEHRDGRQQPDLLVPQPERQHEDGRVRQDEHHREPPHGLGVDAGAPVAP